LVKTLYPKVFQPASHTTTNYGLRIYDAPTNLPVRDPASTNLLAHSLTLWTSPPIVQHMWSTIYEPPHSQHLSSVTTKHMNLPAHIPTREY